MKTVYSFYEKKRRGRISDAPFAEDLLWGHSVANEGPESHITAYAAADIPVLRERIQTEHRDEPVPEDGQAATISALLEVLEEERNRWAANGISLDYVVNIDRSDRFLTGSDEAVEHKNITVVEICCRINSRIIAVHSFSGADLTAAWLNRQLSDQRAAILRQANLQLLEGLPEFRYIHLSELAAAVLVHEVFGHLFEADNYRRVQEGEVDLRIPPFIQVTDEPALPQSGYCLFDDEGNRTSKLKIITAGQVKQLVASGAWIEGGSPENTRGRLGRNGKVILPRVTNTVLHSTKQPPPKDLRPPEALLHIDSIHYARLHGHAVDLQVASGHYGYDAGGTLYALSGLNLSFRAEDIVNLIVGLYGRSKRFSSSQGCIKKGQSDLGVGYASPRMLLRLDNSRLL